MVEAIEKNLLRGIHLLNTISDEDYKNTMVPPYFSSIGTHVRHILDIFDCIFEGLESGTINLINRKRNVVVETFTEAGILYFNEIIIKLKKLNKSELDQLVKVTDDLGNGVVTANYTRIAILIQAHSHAIHHFSSIGYIVAQLGIKLPDSEFGFNPTTPKKQLN